MTDVYPDGVGPERRAGAQDRRRAGRGMMIRDPRRREASLAAGALRLLPGPARGSDRLRIAVLAPPWIPVPPAGYGGIEAVVALLCEELVARGHDVTLFAAPGSRSSALVITPLMAAHPDEIGSALYESDHVSHAWDEIDRVAERGAPFDVLHDHSGFTALAMAGRLLTPTVHTLHGPFVEATNAVYQQHGHKATLVAISRSQAASAPSGVQIDAIVPNPIVVDDWPLRSEKQDYLLWVGRMDPIKGAHLAIRAAKLAGRRLVLAGPVQPGQERYFREHVEPQVDGRHVQYIGEVGGARKTELFANAAGFLMPVRWREPFGMVMVEALACGTPVIAFPEGAASNIVIDGENGFLVADTAEMADAVKRLGSIDPARCRTSVAERYDVAVTAAGYERVYRQAIASAGLQRSRSARGGREPLLPVSPVF